MTYKVRFDHFSHVDVAWEEIEAPFAKLAAERFVKKHGLTANCVVQVQALNHSSYMMWRVEVERKYIATQVPKVD